MTREAWVFVIFGMVVFGVWIALGMPGSSILGIGVILGVIACLPACVVCELLPPSSRRKS